MCGLFAGLALWAAATGCGVTPQDQTLGTQTFDYTIPPTSAPPGFPLPSLTCTTTTDCTNALKLSGLLVPGLSPVCDNGICAGDVKITILYIIDDVNDPAFTLGIAQGEADKMRDVKMTYGLTSTVNIAINSLDVYVGPDGLRAPADPNSIYLGTIGPIPAMGSFPDGANYLLIQDGTPAHTQFVNYAIMVATLPRLHPGNPIPAGSIEIRMVPIVTLLDR
jgi:hypothetical protein